jgi:hypothetical protein
MLKYFSWYFNNKETAGTYITTISRVQYPLVFQQQFLGQSMIQEKFGSASEDWTGSGQMNFVSMSA